MEQNTTSRFEGAKTFYLYLVSFAALMMVSISAISLIGNLLKFTVLPEADKWYTVGYRAPGCGGAVAPGEKTLSVEQCAKEEERFRQEQNAVRKGRLQSDLVWSLSVLVVGIPLFVFHWRLIRKK